MYAYAKVRIRQSLAVVNQMVLSRTFLSLFAGYAGMFLLNILAYPLLTRIYEPQAFGELAIFTNTVLILSGLGALNLEKAIVMAKSKSRALNLVYVSLGVLSFTCLISGILFFLVYEPFYAWLNITGDLRYYWLLLPVVVFTAGAYQIVSAAVLRKGAFQQLSLNRFLLRAVTLAVQVGLVVFFGARYGLIIGFISGFFLVFMIFLYRYQHLRRSFRQSFTYCKQSWQRFSDIPRYSFPQSLFSHISSKIPFLMVAVLFSIQEVGFFSVAYGLLSIPEALVATAFGDMFFQKISSTKNPLSIKKMLSQYWIGLFLLGLIPFGMLMVHGEQVAVLLMGETWHTTGKMLSAMAPMFLFSFISGPTNSTLTVLRRQKWDLVFGLTSMIVRPLAFYAGYVYEDIIFAMGIWSLYEVIQLTVYNLLVYKLVSQNVSSNNQN